VTGGVRRRESLLGVCRCSGNPVVSSSRPSSVERRRRSHDLDPVARGDPGELLGVGLAALEREVGTQLVVRDVRPVRLTPAGEALCRHARLMLEQVSAAEAELDAIAAVETGRLRIGTYASAGATLVVQAARPSGSSTLVSS
jgi:hypothetical protein